MAAKNNYQELSQIDSCLSQYYSKYMAPVLEQENRRYVKEHQAGVQAYLNATKNQPVFGAGANPFSKVGVAEQLYGKSSDVMVERSFKRWEKDKKIQEDIFVLTTAFHQILVEKNGGKDSKKLRDFSAKYIADRIQDHVVDQLARKRVPNDTIEYICQKGFENNMVVTFGKLLIPSLRSEYEAKVNKRVNEIYKPSTSEKVGAKLAEYSIDIASTAGTGIVGAGFKTGSVMFAKQLASWGSFGLAMKGGDYVFSKGKHWITGEKTEEEKTQDVNKTILGDKNAVNKIKQGAAQYRRQGTELMSFVNSFMIHKVNVKLPVSVTARNESNAMLAKHKGNSDKLFSTIKSTFKKQAISVDENKQPPAWMFNFTAKKNRAYAASFHAYAMEMSKNGKTQMKLSGKVMTLQEVSQRAIDYAHAAVITDKTYRQAVQAVKKQHDQQQTYAHQTSSRLPYAQSSENSSGNTVNQGTSVQAAQANPSFQAAQVNNSGQSSSVLEGWGTQMESMGLSDFSTVSKNLGYVLAMLPDMLIGMFTGKTPNFKLQDNLMPLAAIVGGMFIKNPLLKMLLLGFGGANILNNAGHAAVKDGLAKCNTPVRTYKQYEDEKLNPRIADLSMKGSSMIATIDGKPCVINISSNVADAYQKGVLPLNTLANAVLSKYDAQQSLAAQNYEQHIGMEETNNQQRVLK